MSNDAKDTQNIPDNNHYLEFSVSRVGKQRVPGRVCRSKCGAEIISGNYQRSGSLRSEPTLRRNCHCDAAIIEFTNFLQSVTDGTSADSDLSLENPELTNDSENREFESEPTLRRNCHCDRNAIRVY